MDTDYKSLEQRYGSSLATRLHEEIIKADEKRFSFYQLPDYLKSLCEEMEAGEPEEKNPENKLFSLIKRRSLSYK